MGDPKDIKIVRVDDDSDGSSTFIMSIDYELPNEQDSLQEVLEAEGFIKEDEGVWEYESE